MANEGELLPDNLSPDTGDEGKKKELHHIIYLSSMYQNWFLDYASYVILERAVPYVNDGLKPVQRRILHAMRQMDDGRYTKVANIIGQTMMYHPHGDAFYRGLPWYNWVKKIYWLIPRETGGISIPAMALPHPDTSKRGSPNLPSKYFSIPKQPNGNNLTMAETENLLHCLQNSRCYWPRE